MILHGVLGEAQLLTNLLIGPSPRNPLQNFQLPISKVGAPFTFREEEGNLGREILLAIADGPNRV